ncbi:MAG: transcriptional regulator [Acidobacteria bacterium]|nr:MAG: transcriptional regulator [Acidobacteriota bacterium]REK01957.1 MAG: transcriptional regulator [Acidobacteriota bacterium]REK14913.1 MAG: transcriptional regulator [Acidobacteriota bacterium]REK45628.1 MAG: transcriptional regulator [Acidobacteriota bacterium]
MANSQFAMAVHVLTMLATNCDERVKSNYLAKSVNTNAVVIRRLLCDLHEAGLVVSRTGYSGGTCLTKDPKNIDLLDVYEAVSHGEVFSLHKQKPDQDCPVGKNIEAVLCNLQKEIDEAVRTKLSKHTLSDVMELIRSGESVSI